MKRGLTLENNPTWTPVVALALFDQTDRVLMQQRLAGKQHGGLWEFPGGKVENGEIPRFALVREIAEELSLELNPDQLTPSVFAEEVVAKHIVLFLYISRQECGEVEPRDGQEWGWFGLEDASRLELAPMDRAMLRQLLQQRS